MAVSDVVPQQDGGLGNVKLHPYLVTLVRWCVSRLWSTCGALLQRLLSAPLHRLPQITAANPPPRAPPPRAASSAHLHPEPRVECAVLHAPPPAHHQLDVVFVHGLYGSLGNTWRQGEWRTKYKLDPTKVPLRDHSTEPCSCSTSQHRPTIEDQLYQYDTRLENTFQQLNGCFQKILPNENSLITEQFYNNTLLDVNNYETQAHFVTELFKNDCDTSDATFKCNGFDGRCVSDCECKVEVCKCASRGGCEAGCGCVCDACYSHCWPRDWLREDFPGARVISVNYTSDPYLWRPLWVKGTKRLRLHERAEQMMSQLLALGVGQRPVVWVGHSKGGLFIKQIYCQEDRVMLSARASLWTNSAGFMFYSVPHRGSPLADIKTPLTARSVELQEIAKDCPLVLELQRGWLAAAHAGSPLVRSLVETTRTLMAVLWLRIVSEDSADAGVGVLHGVSVDHREICKPSSRRCLLYTELTHLIQAALTRCRCQ